MNIETLTTNPNRRFKNLERAVGLATIPAILMGTVACSADGDNLLKLAEACDPGSDYRQSLVNQAELWDEVRDANGGYISENDLDTLSDNANALQISPEKDNLIYAVDLLKVESISSVNTYDTEAFIEDVENVKAELVTEDAKLLADKLTESIVADDLMSEASYEAEKMTDNADPRLEVLSPDAKVAIQEYISASAAYDLVNIPGSTTAEATENLTRVTGLVANQPEIVATIQNLLHEFEAGLYPDYSYRYASSNFYRLAIQQLRELAQTKRTAAQALIGNAWDIQNAIKSDIREMVDGYESGQVEQNKEQNQLDVAPAVIDTLNLAIEDNRTLDLSRLDGTAICMPEWNDKDRYAREFASVNVNAGEVSLGYEKDAEKSLSTEDAEAVQATFNRLKPLLESAYGAGKVSEIHLMVDAKLNEFNAYYLIPTREVYIILPSDGEVSVEQFQAAVTHELTHAIGQDIVNSLSLEKSAESEALRKEFVEACNEVVKDDVRNTLNYLSIYSSEIDTLANAGRSYSPLFAALKGALDTASPTSSVLVDGVSSTYFCNSPSVASYLYELGGEAGLEETQDISDVIDEINADVGDKTSPNNEAAVTLITSWNYSVKATSLGDLFNERNYVESDDSSQPYLGHVDDNESELFASIVDTALNYPDELSESLNGLDEKKRAQAIRILQGAMAIFKKELGNTQPYIDSLVQNITK